MDFAEQVKSQVDIVRTVSDYVVLRKNGARYVGLCPFHTEKTPSFSVNPAIQIYKCFGCGVAGDVIKFIQEIESLTFWEALKALAERNGIPIPQRRQATDAESDLRAAVFEMYEAASKIYQEALFSSAGQAVRDYLGKRGLTASTAQHFGLGYSEPGWENLLRRFVRKYSPAQLEASGLFSKREDGSFFDRFRGRLMFPIHNESGKTIGFGGRALGPEDEPKYLNSPETPIYKKSSVLYNLHRAKETIRKEDRTILVEGYMDVIGVYAAGVRNVVASCGTALTSNQVRSMKRHSDKIVVNFDPDVAGANATERSIQMLLEEGMQVRILELEEGLDPDEYIKKYGASSYQERLRRSTGYFLWLADRARRKFDMKSAQGRMEGYETMLLPAIRRISDRLERAAVATEVADYLGLDRNLVLEEFRRTAGAQKRRQAPAPTARRVHPRQAELLRSLVINPEIRPALLPALQASKAARTFAVWPVLERMMALFEADPRFTYESLEKALDQELKDLVVAELFSSEGRQHLTGENVESTLLWLAEEDWKAEIAETEHRLREAEKAGNFDEAIRLMMVCDSLKKAPPRSGSY